MQDSPVRANLVFARNPVPTTGRMQDSPVRSFGPRARKLRKPCEIAARSDLKTHILRLQKHLAAGLKDSRIGETPHGRTEKCPGSQEETTPCRRHFLGHKKDRPRLLDRQGLSPRFWSRKKTMCGHPLTIRESHLENGGCPGGGFLELSGKRDYDAPQPVLHLNREGSKEDVWTISGNGPSNWHPNG